MTDPEKRIEDMDRVGIDVEVVSLSTPNVYFTDAERRRSHGRNHPCRPRAERLNLLDRAARPEMERILSDRLGL